MLLSWRQFCHISVFSGVLSLPWRSIVLSLWRYHYVSLNRMFTPPPLVPTPPTDNPTTPCRLCKCVRAYVRACVRTRACLPGWLSCCHWCGGGEERQGPSSTFDFWLSLLWGVASLCFQSSSCSLPSFQCLWCESVEFPCVYMCVCFSGFILGLSNWFSIIWFLWKQNAKVPIYIVVVIHVATAISAQIIRVWFSFH